MFTGLIEVSGALRRLVPKGPGATLTLSAPSALVGELALGESVAVDGACLTVTSRSGDTFEVDASLETLERTTLGQLRPGDRVHLERALRLGDRLGGHLVSGHIDATGTVRSRAPVGEAIVMVVAAPPEVLRYVVVKGSIAVDGVSLTVNALDADSFSLFLIPHTQSIVHLHEKAPGVRVNLEVDVLGKYVERLLQTRPAAEVRREPLDLDFLARNGFT